MMGPALASVATVGLAALSTGIPAADAGAAPPSTMPNAASVAAVAAAAPGATPAPSPTPTPTLETPSPAATTSPSADPSPAEDAPAPVDVSHLPPPPAAAQQPDAATAARSRATVGRVIQVRAGDIRLLSNGRVLHEGPRPAGAISLTQLAGYLGSPRWLELSGGQATIKAAIYLSPGTHLTITGADAKSVRLQQTPSGYGGSIYGSGSSLTVTGVTVTGWDPVTGKPAAPSEKRPFISFNRGSTLRLQDSTFTALGRAGSGQTGVSLHDGAEFSALRVTFEANIAGMTSVRTGQTRLDRVTARSNAGTGVVVRGGRVDARSITATSNAGPGFQVEASPSTDIWSVRSERNTGPGLSLRDSNSVALDAVRANGNGSGMEVVRSSRVEVTDTVTTGNAGWGIDVAGSNTISLNDTSSVQDRSGLTVRGRGSATTVADAEVHSSSDVGIRLGAKRTQADDLRVAGTPTGVVLDATGVDVSAKNTQVSGARTGLRVMPGSTGASVSGAVIGPIGTGEDVWATWDASGSADAGNAANAGNAENTAEGARADIGADVAGQGTSLTDIEVDQAATGVVVRAGADAVDLTRITTTGTDTGIRVQEGVDGISLNDVTVTGGTVGLDSASSGLVVDGARFTQVNTGAKLAGSAALTGVNVDASECGVRSIGGSTRISGGSIRAERASCGDADLGDAQVLPPTDPRGLGLFAGGMVTLAVVYESVRALRERRRPGSTRRSIQKAKTDEKHEVSA